MDPKGEHWKALRGLFRGQKRKDFLATVGSNTAGWGLSQLKKAGYKSPSPECNYVHSGLRGMCHDRYFASTCSNLVFLCT